MKRLGGGYAWYFNNKHGRIGNLFRSRYKAASVDRNEYLLHVSAYINLNWKVHGLRKGTPFVQTSWEEYEGTSTSAVCNKSIVLDQFQNKNSYKNFADAAVKETIRRRREKETSESDYLLLE